MTRKRTRAAFEGSDDSVDLDASENGTSSLNKRLRSTIEADTGEDQLAADSIYEVVGVMRNKYVFKTRPKPINAKLMMKKKAKKP